MFHKKMLEFHRITNTYGTSRNVGREGNDGLLFRFLYQKGILRAKRNGIQNFGEKTRAA